MISLVVIGIFLLIAQGRSGANLLSNRPSNLKSFVTDADFEQVMKAIVRFAQQSIYSLDTFDEENGFIVLSESASATHWGFLYPIYLDRKDGKTIVEVGIKAKVGFIIHSSNYEKCFNQIKAAVFAAAPLLPSGARQSDEGKREKGNIDQRLRQVRDLIEKGNRRQAVKILNGLLEENPRNEDIWVLAADAFDNKASKVKVLEKALTFLPDSYSLLRLLNLTKK